MKMKCVLVCFFAVFLLFSCGSRFHNNDSTFIKDTKRGILCTDYNGQMYFVWAEGDEKYAIPVIGGLIPEYEED